MPSTTANDKKPTFDAQIYAGGSLQPCKVVDLVCWRALVEIENAGDIELGTLVLLKVGHCPSVAGHVHWNSHGRIGIRFLHDLHDSVVAGARLLAGYRPQARAAA
ncbi:hypothetical protein [Parerythrobacter aestuarii]|uniref:hypothetical protein n=1 Tax=Parerythrobacter aestuarii TaxID=3020909 RepID=UPI0024DE7809|nr:hypothetical protein [Parerythrobacter aestuarii]